jgi:hypothetical protein
MMGLKSLEAKIKLPYNTKNGCKSQINKTPIKLKPYHLVIWLLL